LAGLVIYPAFFTSLVSFLFGLVLYSAGLVSFLAGSVSFLAKEVKAVLVGVLDLASVLLFYFLETVF
jgi:hypothetical protein